MRLCAYGSLGPIWAMHTPYAAALQGCLPALGATQMWANSGSHCYLGSQLQQKPHCYWRRCPLVKYCAANPAHKSMKQAPQPRYATTQLHPPIHAADLEARAAVHIRTLSIMRRRQSHRMSRWAVSIGCSLALILCVSILYRASSP